MLIKVCGLSTPETIAVAADAGATHVGLVHFEPSPRHLSLADAADLRAGAPAGVKAVLLMVNPDAETTARALEIVRPDVVQFHGEETPEWVAGVRDMAGVEVWKALRVRDQASLAETQHYEGSVDRLLFDAPAPADSLLPGGNGEVFDWPLLKGHEHRVPWGLAGGLTPANVADAIRQTGAPMVDASSGLESAPGVKDVDKIAAFCKAALHHD